MSALPKLQRNSFAQNLLKNLFFLIFYVFYIALSSVHIYLPPFLGVLFAKYIKDLKESNFLGIFTLFLALLVFETQKSSYIGVAFLFFVCLSLIARKIASILHASRFVRIIYVILVYVGYFFILQCISLWNAQPPMQFDVWIWYILIESMVLVWKK